MKINNIKVTPNELAKIEILEQLQTVLYDGLEQSGSLDTNDNYKPMFTNKEQEQTYEQLNKRTESIRTLLGADKLSAKFGINV